MSTFNYYQLLITDYPSYNYAGMAELADALDLGSRYWGFDSLFPYRMISNE